MPYSAPNLDEIRSAILRDIQNLLPEADTGIDSDYFIRASSVASAIEGLYQHQAWITDQIFPDTADHEYLLLHARLRGLYPKPAVAATGSVTLTGVVGTNVPSALALKSSDGRDYVTTSGGTITPQGALVVTAAAVVAGSAGNLDDGTQLTLTIPPPGVNSTATVIEMRSGVDAETDAELLARLLERIRRPPAGGNKYDYWGWAMEVPGVTAAFIYPLRRGLGTVDIVIVSDNGLPSDQLIEETQDYIDDRRPVTAKGALVLAPTPKTFDIEVSVLLDGISLDDAKAAITAAVHSYVDALSPGDAAIKSRIEALISDIDGVEDRNVTAPAANVVPTVDETKVEWCRIGQINVTSMT